MLVRYKYFPCGVLIVGCPFAGLNMDPFRQSTMGGADKQFAKFSVDREEIGRKTNVHFQKL